MYTVMTSARSGKEKVQVEINLYATGYNLIRLKHVQTVPLLLEKLSKWNPIAGFFVFLRFFVRKRFCFPLFSPSKPI
jgi:hypothetical protein